MLNALIAVGVQRSEEMYSLCGVKAHGESMITDGK